MIVPRVQTPIPIAGLDDQLDAAHRDLRAFAISEDAYRLAVAQLKLEHGQGYGVLHGCFNFNLGNHDATAADRADPTVPIFETVPEHEGNTTSTTTQVHWRRSYPDLESGLIGYWRALLDGFPDAYDALCTGDPDAFAAALKKLHYFTADESMYARDLRALLAQDPAPPDTEPVPTPNTSGT